MAEIDPTELPEPPAQFTFTQLRQILGNVNIKVVRGGIQSSNYVVGVSGWRISGDGTYEFN